MNLKRLIRRGANSLGIDIIRFHKSTGKTLLGLARKNFGSIIDVGANEGQFARLISEFFPNAELYCFEPLEDPFRRLSAWADLQDGRVRCFNFALGDQDGEAEMHLHKEHTPSSSLLSATENCHQLYPQTKIEHITQVRVFPLDQVLKDVLDHMPRDILLKLDVQGFEDRVLRGAGFVLSQCRALVLEVCLDPLYDGQADFRSLTQLLHEVGFRYAGNVNQMYGEDGRVLFLDAMFVKC